MTEYTKKIAKQYKKYDNSPMKPVDAFFYKEYGGDDLKLIKLILDWSKDNAWFNIDYVNKLKKQIDEGKSLTNKQRVSVCKIILKCKIKNKVEKDE